MLKIQSRFNELNEASNFLHAIAQNINYEELYREAKDSCFGVVMYEKMLDTVVFMKKTIEKELDKAGIERERINFYYKVINKEYLSIADFVLFYDYIHYDETLESIISKSQSCDKQEKLLSYAKLIAEYPSQGSTEEINEVQDLSDLIRLLDESAFDNESKLNILNIFCNSEKYINELKEILEQTIKIVKENHDKYKFIEDFCFEYWTNFTKTNDIQKLVKKVANVEWRDNPNGIVIQFWFAFSNRFSVSLPDEENEMDLFRIGILVDEKLKMKKKLEDSSEIAEIMKAFSDKSKLDILTYIKDKTAYGKELADQTGLAKGTISHHMSSLIQIGIIDTLCESNRIYYKLNKERLGEILDEIKWFFVSGN